jgi:hypothetical protein
MKFILFYGFVSTATIMKCQTKYGRHRKGSSIQLGTV